MGKSRTWTDEQFIKAVANNQSIRQVLFDLGLATEGGSYKTVHTHLKRLNLDTSHFTGQQWNKGRRFPPKRDIAEYLVTNGPPINSSSLRRRLIKEGYLDAKCSICQIDNWLNKPLKLQLDHINGNHLDNRLDNLRILCPNCHTQTDTYCLGHKRSAKRDSPRFTAPAKKKPSVPRATKIDWPSNEDLRKMLAVSNYSQVGKQLGVSDNAVRKRLNKTSA